MEDNTKKLYEVLSSNGYKDLGDYKDFEGKLKDSGKREILYGKLKEDGFEDIGSLSDFNAKLGYPDIDTTTSGDDKGFWDTYLGDAIEKLNTGGAQLGAGLFGVLDKATSGIEKLGLGTRGGMFKDVSDYFKGVAETSRANSDRYNGKSYSDLWKEGDYAGAIGDIALQGVESLPMSISAAAATIAVAPVAGLAGIGAITASDKYDQLDAENPDMGEFAKVSNAIITGTAEGASEMLGAGVSNAWMKTLYKSLGKEKAEQAVRKGLMGQIRKHFKEFGIFYEPTEEGIEEVASQLAENITDKITGADPNRNLMDGVGDSFIYGMGGGAYFSAAGAPGFVKRQHDKMKTRRDYKNAKIAFDKEFQGDNEMLGIGNELEAATPEEKVAFLEALESSDKFSQEQKEALFNLVQSNIAYKSLRTPEAINEEKGERRELAIQTEMMNYDNANAPFIAENGMIQQVFINGDMEHPVCIVKGDVVIDSNYNGEMIIDPDKSSESMYYRDPEGNTQVISSKQISGIANVVSAIDQRAQYEANLRAQFDMQDQMIEQQRAQEEEQEISNGDDVAYIDPDTGKQVKGRAADIAPNADYMSVETEDGKFVTVPKQIVTKSAIQSIHEQEIEKEDLVPVGDTQETIVPDEEVQVLPKENEETKESVPVQIEKPDAAQVVVKNNQGQAEVETTQSEADKSPIIMKEDGTPDFIASGEGNTLDFLSEKYKDKMPRKIAVTRKAFENDLRKASDALEKAQLEYDDAPIGKENKAEKALLKAQQVYDSLKQESDFWIGLDNIAKEDKPGDQIAKEIGDMGDPVNGEELAAMLLANGTIRLTRDSYMKETGSGNEESKKMFGLFASPTKGGVNIERAGELLMLADLERGTNFFDQNDPNAGRNAIIDVLSSARTRGDLINYMKANREAMSERERLAEYNEYAAWCEENYHLSPEDYEVFEEDMRKQAEAVTDETIEYVNSEIADEIQSIKEEQEEIDAILAQNIKSNEEVKRNDEGRTGGLPEGSNQLLQDEQLVQGGRVGDAETEYSGTDGRISNKNGIAQESTSGEIKPVGVGSFGNIYDQFKGNAKDAIEFLLKKKEGEAVAALHHRDVGDIDLVWGKTGTGKSNGFGLSKLAKYHPEVLDNLQMLIDDMEIVDRNDNRINLESKTHKAAVRLEWDGYKKNWLLTAFEKEKPTAIDRTTDIGDTELQNDTAPLQTVSSSDYKDSEVSGFDQIKLQESETAFSMMDRVAAKQKTRQDISKAEQVVDTNPTDAQKEAGNYRKGHVRINGFDVTIEQPAGSVRSGKDAYGKEWSITMNNTYGYIRGTEGVDGDHIDVFLGLNPKGDKVFVVDQVNPDKSFDEHKVMMGFDSLEDARRAYLSNYEEGWQGLGNITEIPLDDFKKWVDSSHRKTKPFAEYKIARGVKYAEKTNNQNANTGNEVTASEPSLFFNSNNSIQMQIEWGKSADHVSVMPVDEKIEKVRNEVGYESNTHDVGITFMERQLTEKGGLTFMGSELTGASRIKSSRDIAFLFKNLESAATENSFLVMIRADGTYGVYYSSTGGTDATLADVKLLMTAAKEFGAKKVCFVHNHPSGTLRASIPDINIHKRLKKAMFNTGIETMSSIVINLDSGKYLQFDENEGVVKEKGGNPKNVVTPQIYQFDRSVFYKPSGERVKIRDASDIAKFISKQKRGIIPKLSAIILDHGNNINKYAFLDPAMSREELVAALSYEAGKHGNNVILTSNAEIDKTTLRFIQNSLSAADINLLDVLEVKQDEDILYNYKSYANEGVMDSNAEYKIAKEKEASLSDIPDITEEYAGVRFRNTKSQRSIDEKGKLLDSLSGITTPGFNQETSLVSGIKDTKLISILQADKAKIINKEGEITSAVDELAGSLNTPVHIIKDVNEITDDDLKQQRQKRGSKGWYDTKTREVYLVIPNAESVADVQATVLHEVVAHKGLRGLLGENFSSTMGFVFDSLPKDV